MKKKQILYSVMTVLTLFLMLPIFTYAQVSEDEQYREQLSAYDFSFFDRELDKETRRYLKELKADTFDFHSLFDMDTKQVGSLLYDMAQSRIKRPLKGAVSIIAYVVFAAMLSAVRGEHSAAMSDSFSTVSALAIAVFLTASVGSTVAMCTDALGVAGHFIYAFVPVFCSVVLASGKGTTAFAAQSMLLMLSQGVSFIASNVFMPVVNCLLALGICSGMREELKLEKLVTSIKNGLIWCISFVSGAFVCVLSLKTAVAGRADILGIRSARFVINSVVPVIGSSVSEGLLTIQTYSSLIKTSVGVVGILAIILLFLPPILEVALWRGVLSLCSTVSDIFDCRSVSQILSAYRYALLVANVLLILSALTTVVSVGLVIAAGD